MEEALWVGKGELCVEYGTVEVKLSQKKKKVCYNDEGV